ncbi:cell morphogenesis C-terminal-domain-containing protein [Sporodiniella umbellata]|nr:cell morphogenesis C-terminal-domain-containing protein [Sporodiniella umbellata]
MSLDQTFGKLLVLDEKNIILRPFSAAGNVATLNTNNYSVPIFANSGGTSESGPQIHHQYTSFLVSYTKDKQPYFDVIKSILDCIPRLMPAGIALPKLIEMLARYAVHTDPEIIKSASKALIRIATQVDSQTVALVFLRHISKIEDKYVDIIQSLATGPIVGTSVSESGGIIGLYVELLSIWAEQLESGTLNKDPEVNPKDYLKKNMGQVLDMIQETEADGLWLLCSQSPLCRKSAFRILKITANISNSLKSLLSNEVGEPNSAAAESKDDTFIDSMYSAFDCIGQEMLKMGKDTTVLFGSKLSAEARSKLIHHQRKNTSEFLCLIAESDQPSDTALWNACFPEILKRFFQSFPQTTAQCRIGICNRILQINPLILAWMETMKASATGTLSISKNSNSSQKTASLEVVDQWRIYLMFTCITATHVQEAVVSTPLWSSVGRKEPTSIGKISSPRDLFRLMLPFLTCEHRQIREGVIEAFGHINKNVYKFLIAELEGYVRIVLEDGKQRNNQKPYQNKRSKKNDRLRISIMSVFEFTADSLSDLDIVSDKNLTNVLTSFIKETKSFLADTEAQLEWDYQRLRIHLCGLVEKLYDNIMQLDDPTAIMSFETRLSLYKMFEEWCGYGVSAKTAQQREATMMRDILEQYKESKERENMTQLMEEEGKHLQSASLSAMAMLCRGPLYAYLGQKKARQAIIQFDTLNVLKWIDAIFESHDPNYHKIARRALEAVMIYNQDQAMLLDDIIEQCYAGNPKLEFTQGYFQALSEIVTKFENYPYHIHQIMSLALFKTGDTKKAIRKTAIQLLRIIEERVFEDSCAKEYEIGITSSLPAIYKHTQTLLSARLALDHPEQTYSMLSEITQRFEHISPNSQREVLTYMLPWHRKLDLSVDPDNAELSASTYMVLSNLFYITIKFGDVYVKEIATLWSQLADNNRNVKAIIMYLLDMGQEKRNPWFLIHAKRVFVFLGRTHAFNSIIEEVTSEITPRSMVPQTKDASSRHANAFPLLFVADTENVLPHYPKKPMFSRGQLAMTFLVDLAIEAGADLAPHLPLFLHSVFVQLDHLTSIICDQSRCLLINLIHSIVIRQSTDLEASKKASDIIQWLSSKEGKRLWAYENIMPTNRRIASANELKVLLQKVVEVFSYEDHGLRQKWGETALKWATCCSVRHIACRSFQCFRALMPSFNQHMLADMLARLSNTIADKSEEIRGFALEIILTLTEVAGSMDKAQIEQFPQLFWAAVACLYSPYESEHSEALSLLEVVIEKYENISKLVESFPKDWSSEFDGLQPLLLKGLQFSSTEDKIFRILNSISLRDNLPLIDPSETRLLYLLLGCLPRLLHGLDHEKGTESSALELVEKLVCLLEGYDLTDTQRILMTFPIQKSKFQEDYLKQILGSLKEVFLAKYSRQALIFSLLLVKNKIPFYRDKALMMIDHLLPYVKETCAARDEAGIDIVALEPLLQLVSTEYADRALAILNSGIPTTSGDKSTIVDGEFSWGFNNFAAASIVTKENIHAVVYECSSITNEAPIEHNIQFSVEDFSLPTGEGNPGTENDCIFKDEFMLGVGGTRNTAGQYGEDLMNALKDLDDFFNEEGEPLSPSTTSFFEGSVQRESLLSPHIHYSS